PRLPTQPPQQIVSRSRRMRSRQSDTLIQMKSFHPLPVNAWSTCKRLQKFKLRSARRGNEPADAMLRKIPPNRFRRMLRGSHANFLLVSQYLYVQFPAPFLILSPPPASPIVTLRKFFPLTPRCEAPPLRCTEAPGSFESPQ